MGKGIDACRDEAPDHAAVLDDFKDQLLIAFVKRLGGSVSLPVAEVDNLGGYVLSFRVVDRVFHFDLARKQ
ncbi:MAG: hypothetical protein EG825_00600 [Rhodocyclaceae bacterium]|nr:hypothetical protein [Rhodocyclaceae bacterium]